MKLSSSLQFFTGYPDEFAKQVVDLESAGVDRVWAGEAYGVDLATPLGYVAAKTTSIDSCTPEPAARTFEGASLGPLAQSAAQTDELEVA